jgi:aspartate-semialdehyde dehydrogenase
MNRVGLIGWRGMVGSVLLSRMRAEGDFAHIDPVFFSTSMAGTPAPDTGQSVARVFDANDAAELARCDILISCQGGDYTESVHPKLRAHGWAGHWIDAASALRLSTVDHETVATGNERTSRLQRGERRSVGARARPHI